MYVLSVGVNIHSLGTLILIIIMSMSMREWVSVIDLISVVITIHHVNTLRIIHGSNIIVCLFKAIGFLNKQTNHKLLPRESPMV
jgi:hypothetical protein